MITRIRFPLFFAGIALFCWTLLRLALWWRFAPSETTLSETLMLLLAGLHTDLVWALIGSMVLIAFSAFLTTIVAAVPVLVLKLFGIRAWKPVWKVLFRIAITVGCTVGVFLVISEWFFFDEFDSRFNTVAIDYLIYPHEVFTNLRESYPLPLIIASCLLGGVGIAWLGFKKCPPAWDALVWSSKVKFIGFYALACLVAHQTIFSGETSFSRQRVVNQLADNGWASAAYAAWSRNLDYKAFYRTMDRREAFVRARKVLAEPGADFPFPEPPALPPEPMTQETEDIWLKTARDSLVREIAGDASKPKRNVCIIAEESFGSEFWGCLGRNVNGKAHTLTPRMDALAAQEGLLFTRILADGNRTIRGMEAIFSSIPPLPGDSILARDKSENVETIARVLKRDGYNTLFCYAGRGTFDFIKSYVSHNGWDRLVEESDFTNPVHRTAWGVSDEDRSGWHGVCSACHAGPAPGGTSRLLDLRGRGRGRAHALLRGAELRPARDLQDAAHQLLPADGPHPGRAGIDRDGPGHPHRGRGGRRPRGGTILRCGLPILRTAGYTAGEKPNRWYLST